MASQTTNTKRIAKNTLMLYMRMLLIMAVSLYTSRVVLEALGVQDYGVYSVVGGVVAMFAMLSSSLSSPIQRFLSFELGKIEKGTPEEAATARKRLAEIFSTSMSVQICGAIILFLLIEIVGFWFLNNYLKIPEGRMGAAHWVLHCSIITFCINLLSVPYNATLIANERMSAFAYISILEAALNLLVAYLVLVSDWDKLQLYATLIMTNAIIIRITYSVYCSRHFQEAHYHLYFNRQLFKEMASFAGWSFFSQVCSTLNTQGINLLMNLFFGVVANAARGVAVQVENAVVTFSNNFVTALNPQITKNYSAGNLHDMTELVCRGTKFSFFIMYLLVVPLVIEAPEIMRIWLKVVPEGAVTFVRLTLFAALINVMGGPTYTAIMATGKIKRYALEVNGVSILVFPLTWLTYRLGAPAYIAYVVLIVVRLILTFIRLRNLNLLTGISIGYFLRRVWGRAIIVGVASFVIPVCIYNIIPEGFLPCILVCTVAILSTASCIWVMGMSMQERLFVKCQIEKMILKTRNKNL